MPGFRLPVAALAATCLGLNFAAAAVDAQLSVEELTEQVRRSLVVVETSGREGRRRGEGTGFAVGEDLIATARHVIGEGRPINVLLPDNRRAEVTHVHAHVSHLDLVILRTKPHGLPPIPIGDPEHARTGVPVVVLGHPQGLRNSVVSGVISGRREIDGVSMIQLAMAIEPGNSGGPVVDHSGVVLGMVTLKSTASDNIGFALPVIHLQNLLAAPNPIPLDRWIRIGALDERWEVVQGGVWRQRAGRVSSESPGTGFGGRTLCLLKDAPKLPVEMEVTVRLDDERGAAGLAVHADGDHRHYGFYPSAGNLRFTRFDGPDVNSWTILHNEPHPAWRPGEWNTLRVRIEPDRIDCYLNDAFVLTVEDQVLSPGRVGYAAFRGTRAEFRGLTVARSIPSRQPTAEQKKEIAALLSRLQADAASGTFLEQLLIFGPAADTVLRAEADALDKKARQTRALVADLHTIRVRRELLDVLEPPVAPADAESAAPDLLKAALLVARLDNDDIRIEDYIERVDGMAGEIRGSVPDDAREAERIAALDRWLFEENGFRGSMQQYYTPANSYLNEVIDDREGLPITLSVLYMELARRLDLNVVGIGLPGHFIVRHDSSENPEAREWIDVFNRGERLSAEDVETRIRRQGLPVTPRYTEPVPATGIIERILRNLLALAERDRDDARVLKYLEVLVGLSADDPAFRARRLEMRARNGKLAAAVEDADWFLEHQPEGIDVGRLQQLKAGLEQQIGRAKR